MTTDPTGTVRERINRLKKGRSREVTPEERAAQATLGSAVEEEELLRGIAQAAKMWKESREPVPA